MNNIEETFTQQIQPICDAVVKIKPLVHCITNYVTVNDCANMVLAAGGSPIMADDIGEVEEIVTICNSLVINIGTLNERTIRSMFHAGKKAKALNHPVILDPVGAGASRLRTDTAAALLREVHPSVIRGNLSEMQTLAGEEGHTRGVDAAEPEEKTQTTTMSQAESVCKASSAVLARRLAATTGSVIAVTGAIDYVSNGKIIAAVSNGNKMMARITGSGCMLSALIGAWCGANPDNLFYSTVLAIAAMGICGERAAAVSTGTGSFRTGLIDAMSVLDANAIQEGIRIEFGE